MGRAVAQWTRFSKKARGLTDPVFIQKMSQAPDGHLEYLGRPCLIAVGSMQRSDDVILFKLRKITFKIDSIFGQIKIGDRSGFVL